jgi:hypothetical protein
LTPNETAAGKINKHEEKIMSFILTAFNHIEWSRYGLADYSDFVDHIVECNMGEDAFSGYGEWYFIPDAPLPNNDHVIYSGSWGNDNSPGASSYTHAEIFDMDDPDDAAEYSKRVKQWESSPEWA